LGWGSQSGTTDATLGVKSDPELDRQQERFAAARPMEISTRGAELFDALSARRRRAGDEAN